MVKKHIEWQYLININFVCTNRSYGMLLLDDCVQTYISKIYCIYCNKITSKMFVLHLILHYQGTDHITLDTIIKLMLWYSVLIMAFVKLTQKYFYVWL